MSDGTFRVPPPVNEPVISYAPGTEPRARIVRALSEVSDNIVEIPNVIGGRHVTTGRFTEVKMPCDRRHVIAKLHVGGAEEVAAAADAAEAARPAWAALPWQDRAAVFLKAAELLAGPWRDRVNAATMVGQAKTVYQAEIDAACELIDFWRFNAHYLQQILAEQPPFSPTGVWNRVDHRPLDGFVLAVTPFNFTSIALNLPTAPALAGNTVVWKPAETSAAACWVLTQLLEEAGLPPGVINVVNGPGSKLGPQIIDHPALGGIHFTGSTATFQAMWRQVAGNLSNYRCWPRLVGETGGKDFIVAHPSADPTEVGVAILRGAFEYQGQKCSAASRLYLPKSLWPAIREVVVAGLAEMKMGDVRDLSNFVGAVIDERAFRKHASWLARGAEQAETVAGGTCDDRVGWFVSPTLFRVDDPKHVLMQEELFGPICTAFVYDDARWDEVLTLVDTTSPYALTGAVFARDRAVLSAATERLRFAAGNFYLNDKPTGAVVGQQPFGGGRASGTNDKAGGPWNLLRWVSPRSIKETFVTARDWRYPFLGS